MRRFYWIAALTVIVDQLVKWACLSLTGSVTLISKVLALTGLTQEDMMPMYDGLKLEIGNIPADYVPKDTEVGLRMDEYLKAHNL